MRKSNSFTFWSIFSGSERAHPSRNNDRRRQGLPSPCNFAVLRGCRIWSEKFELEVRERERVDSTIKLRAEGTRGEHRCFWPLSHERRRAHKCPCIIVGILLPLSHFGFWIAAHERNMIASILRQNFKTFLLNPFPRNRFSVPPPPPPPPPSPPFRCPR